ERPRYLDLYEDLNHIADLVVVVALQGDTVLHAGTHLGHVVFEAAQRLQLAFENHHVFTQYANRTVAVHRAFDHHATGHRAKLRRAEHVTYLGDTQDIFPHITAEHTGERLLDVLDDVVNDVVVAHVEAFGLDDLARPCVSTHVEAEQYRIGGERQVGIGLGDATDAATDHTHLHLVVAQGTERALQGF